jgi:hypothetical protein
MPMLHIQSIMAMLHIHVVRVFFFSMLHVPVFIRRLCCISMLSVHAA